MPCRSLHFVITASLSTVLIVASGWSDRTMAHGVVIEASPVQAFQLRAMFDSGTPMSQAQVTIYAPDQPEVPWGQLTTDDEGVVVVSPDPAIAGQWDVIVRQAGHGERIRIAVAEDGVATVGGGATAGGSAATGTWVSSTSGSAMAGARKWVTVAAAVWGFVGTALFFAQRNSQRNLHGHRAQNTASSTDYQG